MDMYIVIGMFAVLSWVVWAKARSIVNIMLWMFLALSTTIYVVGVFDDIRLFFYAVVFVVVSLPITMMVGGRH